MTTTLKFGERDSCEVALGEHTLLSPNNLAAARVDDAVAATRAALAAPRGFPPLAAAVVPGDQVAVAVDRGVAQLGAVLRGTLAELLAAGVDAASITVLSADPLDADTKASAAQGVDGIRFETHNPNDEASIAMVGMTSAHRPLRFNRWLADADFVLPIIGSRLPAADGAPAKFAAIFPRFSNRETADRFHGRNDSQGLSRSQRVAESDEAGWLLGVIMAVFVVPGPAGGVAAVIAGEPGAMARSAAEQFQAIWERPARRQGDLVIAAVTGDALEQTWSNVARAVAASEKVRSPEGAIAVCCALDEPPAGALEQLRDVVDYAAAARDLRSSHGADARPARVLAEALEHGPVYLLSRLPADVVESLGMTPIESNAELSRLAAGRRHCVVIEEAQRVRPRFVGQQEPL